MRPPLIADACTLPATGSPAPFALLALAAACLLIGGLLTRRRSWRTWSLVLALAAGTVSAVGPVPRAAASSAGCAGSATTLPVATVGPPPPASTSPASTVPDSTDPSTSTTTSTTSTTTTSTTTTSTTAPCAPSTISVHYRRQGYRLDAPWAPGVYSTAPNGSPTNPALWALPQFGAVTGPVDNAATTLVHAGPDDTFGTTDDWASTGFTNSSGNLSWSVPSLGRYRLSILDLPQPDLATTGTWSWPGGQATYTVSPWAFDWPPDGSSAIGIDQCGTGVALTFTAINVPQHIGDLP